MLKTAEWMSIYVLFASFATASDQTAGAAAEPKGNPGTSQGFEVSYFNDHAKTWVEGFLWVKGKWVEERTRRQFGIQPDAIDFTCMRQSGICIEAAASVTAGVLTARTTLYDIITWGPRTIRLRANPEGCAQFEITIQREPLVIRGFSRVTNRDGDCARQVEDRDEQMVLKTHP